MVTRSYESRERAPVISDMAALRSNAPEEYASLSDKELIEKFAEINGASLEETAAEIGYVEEIPEITNMELLREYAPKGMSEYSDERLLVEYANRNGIYANEAAEALGFNPGNILPDFLGPVSGGLSAGLDQMQGLAISAYAGIQDADPNTPDEEAAKTLEYAKEQDYQAAVSGRPEYDRIEDIDGPADVAGYGLYQISKAVPMVAGLVTTGLVATPYAAAAASTTLGYGSLYKSSAEDGDPDPFAALALAPVYGALDLALPAIVTKVIKNTGKGILSSLLKSKKATTVTGAITEGATEGGQNELEMLLDTSLTAEEKSSARKNSVVAGTTAGFGISAGSNLIRGPQQESDLFGNDELPDNVTDLGDGTYRVGDEETGSVVTTAQTNPELVADILAEVDGVTSLSDGDVTKAVEKIQALTEEIAEVDARIAAEPTKRGRPTKAATEILRVANERKAALTEEITKIKATLDSTIESRTKLELLNAYDSGMRKLLESGDDLILIGEMTDAEIEAVMFIHPEAKASLEAALAASKGEVVTEEVVTEETAPVIEETAPVIEEEVDLTASTDVVVDQDGDEKPITTDIFEGKEEYSDEVFSAAPTEETVAEETVAEETVAEETVAEGSIEANEEAAAAKLQAVLDEESADLDGPIINKGEEARMGAAVRKLDAKESSQEGTARGRVTLPQRVINGIVRMVLNPKKLQTPVVLNDGLTSPDVATTAEYSEQMQKIYKKINQVLQVNTLIENASKQVFKGKTSLFTTGGAESGPARDTVARQRNKLSELMVELETLVGGPKNLEAIIAAIKARSGSTRSSKSGASIYKEMSILMKKTGRKKNKEEPGFLNQGQLNTTVDVLLSSAFTQHLNGDLENTTGAGANLDIVSGRSIRQSTENQARGAPAPLETANKEGGIIGVVDRAAPEDRGAGGSAYASALGRSIKKILKKLSDKGIEVKVEFIQDGSVENPSFDPVRNVVRIHKDASPEQVLHETMHASVAWFIDQDQGNHPSVKALIVSLKTIFDFVDGGGLADVNMPQDYKDNAARVVKILRDLHGDGKDLTKTLEAVNELIAYGTTMREFKDMLKFIKEEPSAATAKWKTDIKGVWKAIQDVMAWAIGVTDTVANNVLDNSLALLDASLDGKNIYDTTFVRGNRLNMDQKGKDDSDQAPLDNNGKPLDQIFLDAAASRGWLSYLPTERIMINLGLTEEVWNSKVIGPVVAGGKKVGEVVRTKLPWVASRWSMFDALFWLPESMKRNPDQFKGEARGGYQNLEAVAIMLDNSQPKDTERVRNYLDGDLNALDKFGAFNSGRQAQKLRLLLDSTKRFMEHYKSVMTENELAFFNNHTFSETLLYINSENSGASSTTVIGDLENAIEGQSIAMPISDIDLNDKLFDRDLKNDVIIDEPVYQVIITPPNSNRQPYKIMVSKALADRSAKAGIPLPITDGKYKVLTDNEYILTRSYSNEVYRFKPIRDPKSKLDFNSAKEYRDALRNTFQLMASKYAATNLMNNTYIMGREEGVVFDTPQQIFEEIGVSVSEETGGEAGKLTVVTLADAENNVGLRSKLRAGGYIRIPVNTKYGGLSGKLVFGPVMTAQFDMSNNGWLGEHKNYQTLIRFFKKNMTTRNPGTHITNASSNVILAELLGINFADIRNAARIYSKYGLAPGTLTPAELRLMELFLESTAMLGSYSHTEVTKHYAENVQKNVNSTEETIYGRLTNALNIQVGNEKILSRANRYVQTADQAGVDLYSTEDNVFRLAAFMKFAGQEMEKANLTTITPQIAKEAGSRARYSFVDYSNDSIALKNMRNTAIPFITWLYVMVPTLTKTIVTKPWHAANVLITIQAMSLIAAEMGGGEEADKEARRRAGPDYDDTLFGIPFLPYTHIRIPFISNESDSYWFKMGDYFPVATSGKTRPIEFAGLDWFPSAAVPSSPALSWAIILLNGTDPYTGKDLDSDMDTNWERFKTRSAAMYDTMAPPMIRSKVLKRGGTIDKIKYGGTGWVNNELSAPYMAMKDILGLKIGHTNIVSERESKAAQQRKIDRAYKDRWKNAQRDYHQLSAEYKEANPQLAKELEEFERENARRFLKEIQDIWKEGEQ